jgi:hypothetical protein
MTERYIQAAKEMHIHTHSECAKCKFPHSCCTMYDCMCTEMIAKNIFGIDLSDQHTEHPQIPFMGPQGCVLSPELRPICTVHTCEIASMGYTKNKEWDDKYFKLRKIMDEELP